MTKLFVGSLPYTTTEDELHALFVPFGQVASAKLIIDRESGRSKGFGFVEMGNDAEAQEAIKKLNGTNIGGRAIAVNVARPMEKRERGGGGGGFGGGRGGRDGGRGGRDGGGNKGGGFKRW